jgi:phosphoglycerate dehydrogenase-like enzyme
MHLNILISSYLEPELVSLIAATDDVTVHYRPDLIPVPRYLCDHTGSARELTPEQLDEWRDLVASADVMFDFDWSDYAGMRERCTRLRWLQATSAGIGGLMQRTRLDEADFIVTTAGGIHAVPLAEFAVMGALYFIKGVPQLTRWKQQHHWERYTTRQLRGSRALVVGLGGMGREIVRHFHSLGVDVWGLGRDNGHYELDELSRMITRAELDAALPEVDLVILSSPLTSDTEGMLGATQIALMKSDAIVINVSRGQLLDQDALADALAEGRLAGACLDVFTEEPLPAGHRIWELDNVIISPHSASTVSTENQDLVSLFLENLAHLRRGEPMRNVYERARGY